MDSILDTIKKMLGIDQSYTRFDDELINLINSNLATLSQVGIDPIRITSRSNTWDELNAGDRLGFVIEYIYLKVRVVFDPPSTSFSLSALKEYSSELLWRISLEMEVNSYGSGAIN